MARARILFIIIVLINMKIFDIIYLIKNEGVGWLAMVCILSSIPTLDFVSCLSSPPTF